MGLRIVDSWLPANKPTAVASAPEVHGFLVRHDLESAFSQAKDQLVNAFNGPEKVTVELVASPEDDADGGERVVFSVRCAMDRQAFRRATHEFFALLRAANSRIYPLIGLLHDI